MTTNPDNTAGLEPCPFCGGDLLHACDHGDGTPTVWIACMNCHAEGPLADYLGNAQVAWNTRPQPTPPADIAGMLERLELLADGCDVKGLDHLPVVSRENAKPFAADLRALTQYVRAHLSCGGVEGAIDAATGKPVPGPATQELIGSFGLHHRTAALVNRFAHELALKLRRAEEKYGWTDGWASDEWEEECRRQLHLHASKGDPLDVAAYAAFCWHHRWSTAPPTPQPSSVSEKVREKVLAGLTLHGGGHFIALAELEQRLSALSAHLPHKGEEAAKVCVLCGKPNADPRPWDVREPVCPDCQDRRPESGKRITEAPPMGSFATGTPAQSPSKTEEA